MKQFENTEYTEEAIKLNDMLQLKRIKGLTFRVNPSVIVVMQATYGIYIEGKGWLQWNHENAPICGTKKDINHFYLEYGLTNYTQVHFVNPINK